jgi:cbb3-type cytochrome oxidase cytochrome c subunit
MKTGALVFLTAFLALALSWGGFVLAPQIQLGRTSQTNVLGGNVPYPYARPGLAQQGAQVYRENGCMYCHTQQTRQEGSRVEVILTAAGTNGSATMEAIAQLNPELAKKSPVVLFGELPLFIAEFPNVPATAPATKALKAGGGKTEVRITSVGTDSARGWGQRRTVAQDFLFDNPVQPGSRRIGPDLANIGARNPDVNWHLVHLYAPRSKAEKSTMPPYRYLFETRPIKNTPSADALHLSGEYAPPPGYEVVPTDDARALAAYLVSLRADAPLFEAPLTVPQAPAEPASTNGVQKTTSLQ